MPRFDARLPGFVGIGGPPRVVWAAGPRVAIAVGNTLCSGQRDLAAFTCTHNDGSELPAKLMKCVK